MAWTFPAGQIHQEVTSLTLVNNTSKTVDVAVPAGKVWMLLGVKITNPDDVNRDCSISLYKEAAKTNLLRILAADTLAAGATLTYPNSVTGEKSEQNLYSPHPLAAGNILSLLWTTGGASTGGTDADGIMLEYQEVAISA